MSATEILLLRHGQSEGNQEGRFGGHGPTPLTERGRAQATATAAALAKEGRLGAIYASDLPRAVQTAEPISLAVGVPIVTTTAFRERSVGVFTGLTFAEAEARYPETFAELMRRSPTACPPEGETHEACAARAGASFDQIVGEHAHERTLIVSHAFTINLMLRRLLGLPPTVPTFFQTDNCALHRLRLRTGGAWSVVALNDRAHLTSLI
jgi:broad specificity phosphatase PhoE